MNQIQERDKIGKLKTLMYQRLDEMVDCLGENQINSQQSFYSALRPILNGHFCKIIFDQQSVNYFFNYYFCYQITVKLFNKFTSIKVMVEAFKTGKEVRKCEIQAYQLLKRRFLQLVVLDPRLKCIVEAVNQIKYKTYQIMEEQNLALSSISTQKHQSQYYSPYNQTNIDKIIKVWKKQTTSILSGTYLNPQNSIRILRTLQFNRVEVLKILTEKSNRQFYKLVQCGRSQSIKVYLGEIQRCLRQFAKSAQIIRQQIELSYSFFGSTVSGFDSVSSDVDLTILTNSLTDPRNILNLFFAYFNNYYSQNESQTDSRYLITPITIDNIRIPILKVKIVDKVTSIAKLTVDISVNNYLGIINSKFLSKYSQITWVKFLGVAVKNWTKAVGLVGSWTLSAYAWILMLIHFLIQKKYLQCVIDHKSPIVFSYANYGYQNTLQKLSVNVNISLPAICPSKNQYQPNLFELFEDFLTYIYINCHHLQKSRFIINFTPTTKRLPLFYGDSLICIIDPFDPTYNPGRLKSSQIRSFLQTLQTSLTLIRQRQFSVIKSGFNETQQVNSQMKDQLAYYYYILLSGQRQSIL